MIKEVIDFCEELFPAISPYTAEVAKRAISQFEAQNGNIDYITNVPAPELWQGDIFDNIPFYYMQLNGRYGHANYSGILLTNTCDCVRNENILFAALLPVSRFDANKIVDLKKNRTYQFLYFPDGTLKDYFIDFGLITTIRRDLFIQATEQCKINKKASLSWLGYYLLISKLTIFFMRPEDEGVNTLRETQ